MPPFSRGAALARACGLVLLAAAIASGPACSGARVFGKTYEYEEDLYLSLDGSADLVLNASIPALVALRGLPLDINPRAQFDRASVRRHYESAITDVTRVSRPWFKDGRRYVQLRIRIADVRRLSEVSPFAWSKYSLGEKDGRFVFTQTVGASALKPGTLQNVGWKGNELVAFRLHLPSKIVHHTARDIETDRPTSAQRGNILVWEQHLADRLDGRPLSIEVHTETKSILYQTLWLFAGAFASAVLALGLVIWWAMRKGRRDPGAGGQKQRQAGTG